MGTDRLLRRRLVCAILAAAAFAAPVRGSAEELPEYRLKAAFLYNFANFTEWPEGTGDLLRLCIYGEDPFGAEIDPLQGKQVRSRRIEIERPTALDALSGCQMVFICSSELARLPRLLDTLRDKPVLTVADSPGAAKKGVMLNMAVVRNRITFEANLLAARAAGLELSSNMLRLATEVIR